MIVLRWLLIASLFICSSCAKFTINWDLCKQDTGCYLLNDCIYPLTGTPPPPPTKFSLWNGDSPSVDQIKDCAFGLQLRYLNNEKSLNYLQIRKTVPLKKIEMYYGDQPVLYCEELNGKIVINKTVPEVLPDPFEKLEIAPYEDVSYFDDEIAVCAFTMKEMKNTIQNIFSIQFDTNTNTREQYNYYIKGLDLFEIKKSRVRCDPDKIRDASAKNGFIVQPVKYKADLPINCSYYKHRLRTPYHYHLYVVPEDTDTDITPVRVSRLECDISKNSGEWDYKYNNGTADVFLSDQFTAYCAAEINKTCENPTKIDGQNLIYTDASNGENPTLDCPDSQWLIDGVYHKGVKAICKTNYENEPVFSIKLEDGSEIEVAKGTELIQGKCFKKYDCVTKSKLDVSFCDKDSSDCSNITMSNELKCDKPGDFDLVVYTDKTTRDDTQKYTCNDTTGYYYANSTSHITENSRVICRRRKEAGAKEFSQAESLGMTGGAVLFAVVLAIALPVGIYCCVLKRKRIFKKTTKTKDKWKQMSTSMKLDEARKIFATEVSLLDGLKLLDTILESESEEPELWDIVLPFLKRFQAVAYSHAPDLEKKFNRYCYLHARRIINKHGWLSKTPITQKNYSGFIRTCAIHLLSRARRNDIDAQKMVLEGFRVLEFNGLGQYPHCGLLWAVVLQQRVGVTTIQKEVFRFISTKTVDVDDDIKEEDQLPQFGGVTLQVKFALGAADVVSTETVATETFRQDGDSALGLKFMEGMLYTTSGNNLLAFLYDLMEDEKKKKIFMEMVVPSRSALEELVSTWIFNRRFRDAKEVEKKFNECFKELEEAFAKMHGNMKDFSKKTKKSGKKDGKEVKKDEKEKAKEEEKAKDETSKATSKKAESEAERSYSARGVEESSKEQRAQSAYVKAKIVYQQFIDYMDLEKGSIIDWIEGKIQTEEPKIPKNEPDRLPNSTRHDSFQVKADTYEWKDLEDDLFWKAAYEHYPPEQLIEIFVESFYKDWSVPRITTCPCSEAEQKKLRSILQMILSEKTLNGELLRIPPLDIVDILENALAIFKTEPVFIEDIPAGITVVGDIHGQLFDLARVLNVNAKDGKPGYECGRYLFLGDFTDRGPQIMECILTLFILKILYPDRFYILRGNHEVAEQLLAYGTWEEIECRFHARTSEDIWNKLTETFNHMSFCAVVGGKIFCAHGGISPGTINRHELRLFRKPVGDLTEDFLLADLCWNDPTRATEGFYHNDGRGAATFYGPAILKSALDSLECSGLIRAHQSLKNGYSRVFPNCLSIFSATNVDGKNNPASVVQIAEDLKHTIVLLKRDPIFLEVAEQRYKDNKTDGVMQKEDAVTKRETKRAGKEIDEGGVAD